MVKVREKISGPTLTKISNAVATEIDIMNRERLNLGIDADGKKIKKLSIDYDLQKRLYVRGALKHRKKTLQRKPEWYKDLYAKTEYAAKSVPNYGRRSGKSLSSLITKVKSKQLKTGIEITANLNLKPVSPRKRDKQEKIIQGLKDIGRNYYGLLAPENTNRGRIERERIRKAIQRVVA